MKKGQYKQWLKYTNCRCWLCHKRTGVTKPGLKRLKLSKFHPVQEAE